MTCCRFDQNIILQISGTTKSARFVQSGFLGSSWVFTRGVELTCCILLPSLFFVSNHFWYRRGCNEDSFGAPFVIHFFYTQRFVPVLTRDVFFFTQGLFSGGHHLNDQPYHRIPGVNGSTCSRAQRDQVSSGTRAIGSSRDQRHCRSEVNGESSDHHLGDSINGGTPKKGLVGGFNPSEKY